MKQITLNFREVAVDGLPEKSMDVVAVSEYLEGYLYISHLSYSMRYRAFNVYDSFSSDETKMTRVKYWIPRDEFDSSVHSGETP